MTRSRCCCSGWASQGTFRAAGRRLYLVGGSVRDTLLGRPVHDLDLTTDAPPAEIKRLLQRVRPDAIYDVGPASAPWGPSSVTPRIEPAGGSEAEEGANVEITTFRSEQYADGTRKPEVTFGTSLEDDLARRTSPSTPWPRRSAWGT